MSGIPTFIERVMEHGADLAGSASGGKDSDAMLRFMSKLHQERGWKGNFFALFCELGRIEWVGVTEHLHKVCSELKLPLIKLFPKRSMVDEWQHRYETIIGKQEQKPFWSSSAARYCTDREKTQTSNKFFRGSNELSSIVPIDVDEFRSEKPFWSSSSARFCTKHEKTQTADKRLRQYDFVICAIGIRAEESDARAKKPRYQVRDDIAATWYKTPRDCKSAEEKEAWAEHAFQLWLDSGRKGRFALTWHPIHDWRIEEVWAYNGTSSVDVARRTALYKAGKIKEAIEGFPCHWVYAAGNTRLSCALCVLASINDILNGAKHNPWVWAELALMEIVGGWGFQHKRWLASLHEDVLRMSFQERDRLHQLLIELGLLHRWNPIFSSALMRCCGLDQMLFWTDDAFVGIVQAIAQHWAESETAIQ
ncbi:phosphoadenosine phosphosulfate reductase family protein [Oculatella sp. LEGE 06141]|uniref:phosphoadenosine phosphosulfate reductase domain-containing protein n=1 Tax=Oculatella sp. LEGE 06141 TaxID=1828648 RepID=UPI00187F9E33|nr:phosphoadenosine phosphosulfate reductase family protein [Oculatella sp. LEGE 06141]MBE9180258.1 phosphoadenosine phosphosulfate reductase family protein [Oculatella sp. LEGE 06141]